MTVSLDQLRRCTVAVDLGASKARVYLKNTGLIVDEPSVAAVDCRTGSLVAVGTDAEHMTGRTPEHIRVVRPITGGIIVNIDMAQRMLRALIGDKLSKAWRFKPVLRAAVCVPHGSEPLAQRATIETLAGLGARRVELVDSLIAAAVGCGLPVEKPEATMIVMSGAATTQVAVLSLGSIVAAETIPVGRDVMDRAVIQHLRNHHALMIPSQEVHPLHQMLGADGTAIRSTEVHGRDAASGMARSVLIDSESVRLAVRTPLNAVLDGLRSVLHRCPPDLVADLADRGITLTGGSALMPGLDSMLRAATGMPVSVADNPDGCAVRGLGAMLEGRVRPMAFDPVR
ncbi:rod shape-determining protein [Streptantibioticus ferralitis]|uniref:Cell shape-determining protein MreB n=1 Tax=Streptantibioticus ferralitis TaxID=236510 RepID=A0ABT5Z6G1_9ACTN|nr:rod shape-determining protein [Streptantibioticus ferralitis]MDF2259400.1 rod shape-determining protein [Streptantibioticus ferralitis]